MKKRIILISGQQGAGKTTLATALQGLLPQMNLEPVMLKYADPLYEMHEAIYNIMRDHDFTRRQLMPYGQTIDGPLLQLLGTEWGRARDPNIWIKSMAKKLARIKEPQVAIIDDARFPNELEVSPPGRTLKIRLECAADIRESRAAKWRENTNHESETALNGQPYLFDLVLDSGETSLQSMVEKVLPFLV